MKASCVKAVYFSPTGNAETVVTCIAQQMAESLQLPMETIDFTLPGAREGQYCFTEEDIVVFGTPVYAGRIPNKLLPYVQSGFVGGGALAVPVAVYGNRNFDNGLIEACVELEQHGFHTVAAVAVPTEHVFSDKLATGRPNEEDLAELKNFAKKAVEKITEAEAIPAPIEVPGDKALDAYYRPMGIDGKPTVFLKAKPVVDETLCTKCGTCAGVCPMGSIPADAPDTTAGICIKCQACIKKCPNHARSFHDEAFLSHVAMLEANFTRRAEIKTFL